MAGNRSGGKGCLMVIVGFFIIGVLIDDKDEPVNVAAPAERAEPAAPVTRSDTETHARAMAWQFVESVSSPMVVDHEWGTKVDYDAARRAWVARGSFTTNNGQIRRRYRMVLRNTGGDSWMMDDLSWLD